MPLYNGHCVSRDSMTVSEFMDYFRLELYGDWTGLIATSKGIAGLILDVDRDENSDYDEDDREFLKNAF